MFIDNDGKRINPAAVIEHDGAVYNGNVLMFPEVVAAIGITEIAEPLPPEGYDPELYFRTEQDEAPYVVYTPKSEGQVAEIMMTRAKNQRTTAVAAIKVTTASGKVFDGDEKSQGRMSRAITALDPEEETLWVLANNTPTMVTREELREALRLAGAAQTQVWAAPYQQ